MPGFLQKPNFSKIKKKEYENIEPELNRSLLTNELMKFDEMKIKMAEKAP